MMKKRINSSFDETREMLNEMTEHLKMVGEWTENEVESAGFNVKIIDDLSKFSKRQVEEFTDSVIMNIYFKYRKEEEDIPSNYDAFVKEIREKLLSIYDSVQDFSKLVKESKDIHKEMESAMRDYSTYLSSDESKEKEKQQLQEMKDKLNTMEEGRDKVVLNNWIESIESSKTLEFLAERLIKLKDKEIKSIMDSFFTPSKMKYVFDRCYTKTEKLGYHKSMFGSFLNLEETFLDKKYHVFNNLFLFILIRFIGYSDIENPRDALYCQSAVLNMAKLMNHKYKTEEDKQKIIDLITSIEDNFIPYSDIFKEKNDSAPNSKHRIEREQKKREEALENMKAWFELNHYDFDETNSFEENAKLMKELQEKLALTEWLKIYQIPYSEDNTIEELRNLKDDFIHKYDEDSSADSEDNSDEPVDVPVIEDQNEKADSEDEHVTEEPVERNNSEIEYIDVDSLDDYDDNTPDQVVEVSGDTVLIEEI